MKRKRIGLITYHRACNYGAVLQTIASVEFFKQQGYDVEVIDYYPEYLQGFGTFKNTFNQVDNKKQGFIKRCIFTIIKTPSYKRLDRVFSSFVNSAFDFSERYLSIEDLTNNKPSVDYYCSGSDQIWNNYYTGTFDRAFFLDFLSGKEKCISLASSFGKNIFSRQEKADLKRMLDKYSLLAVRESDGKRILDELGFRDSMLLFDPTLLIDPDYWNLFAKGKTIKEKYVLVYQLHGDSDAYEKATEYAKKRKLKVVRIITMYHQIRPGCRNIIVPSIPAFVNLFKHANCVFTDSFHGTVFSIIFKKRVGVRLPQRFNNRITSFLSLVKGSEIIVENLEKWDSAVTDSYMKNIFVNVQNVRSEMVRNYLKSFKNIAESKD